MKHTIISDLDGTIALDKHREHFILRDERDWDAYYEACDLDVPNYAVIRTIRSFYNDGYFITIFTGRSDAVREKTIKWLKQYDVPYDTLVMRESGDTTSDYILKKGWWENYPGRETIRLVLEDRQRVVDMWRENGVPCFQVAPGDF
tara:strand:- start:85 stop:522 length:438 start_codon:yes stop_codon:yes gene_type:complete